MDGLPDRDPPWAHRHWPEDLREDVNLPGVRPVEGNWLRVDEAYAGQMAERERLLQTERDAVLWAGSDALHPGQELLELVLKDLPGLGFECSDANVTCPDGRNVTVDRSDPLCTLARLVQCDLCLLNKEGEEHVLNAAVLCFPASWSLAEKAGKPLTRIHDPVDAYDEQIARRVQRLFDGVQVGRPLWRYNRLRYQDPTLFQPRRETARRPLEGVPMPWLRSERQTILRLPQTRWVLFAIHTYILRWPVPETVE